jgi:hypothetical protein
MLSQISTDAHEQIGWKDRSLAWRRFRIDQKVGSCEGFVDGDLLESVSDLNTKKTANSKSPKLTKDLYFEVIFVILIKVFGIIVKNLRIEELKNNKSLLKVYVEFRF